MLAILPILLVLFIVFKIVGLITWSWLLVLWPLWAWLAVLFCLAIRAGLR